MDELISTGLTEEERALLEATLIEAHEDNTTDIPTNSASLLINESSSRFSSAVWFDEIQKQTVTLAGLGGIGSYVAFLIGRLKPSRLVIYDDDTVEETNLSGQLFSINNIGSNKTTAVCSMVRDYSKYYSIISRTEKFKVTSPPTNIMICGFDNMAARSIFYTTWKSYVLSKPEEDRKKCLFIDGRLAAEEFQVFCMTGNDNYLMKEYEDKWLFPDSEAEATLCSYKQTSFCANMIASVMVNLFVNFVANMCNPIIERELPFFTYYNAERMYFSTKTV